MPKRDRRAVLAVTPEPPASRSGVFLAAAPAIAIAVVALAPFLGKAFTIDDTLFLQQARHLGIDPLHPTAFETVWSTTRERMSSIMPSGPVMAYLLYPCIAADGAEWVAHAIQLALFAVAITATASIARRLGASPATSRAAACLLATTPAALAMAGTAMPDLPAMAFGALGVERAVAWRQSGGRPRAVVAAIALAAAALCRPHLLLVLAPALLACVGDPTRRERWSELRPKHWAPLVACPVIVIATALLTRDPAAPSTALAQAAGRFAFRSAVPGNAVAFLAHWALVIPFAIPWLLLRPRKVLLSPVLYLAAAAAAYHQTGTPGGRPIVVAAAAGLGAAAIWDALRDAVGGKDGPGIALGAWLLVPLAVVPYVHLPSKYLLAAAPAAALLVARAAAAVEPRRARAALAASAAAGLALGVLILRADATLAGTARTAAERLIAPSVAAGRMVWFTGHWGFQWYAERAGGRILTMHPPHPIPGNLLVSSLHSEWKLDEVLPRRTLLSTVADDTPGGRIMSRDDGAGFYSNTWGILPWSWGRTPSEDCRLWSLD